MRRLFLAGALLSLAVAAPSEVLYEKQLDFPTQVETQRDLNLGGGRRVVVQNSPGEYVYAPQVSFLFQKLRPVLPAPFAGGYILNEVPFRVIGHYRVYAQKVITPSVLTLLLPLENTRPGDLTFVYLWDGKQYLIAVLRFVEGTHNVPSTPLRPLFFRFLALLGPHELQGPPATHGATAVSWGWGDTRGAVAALAEFSPRLATKGFGYGVRLVIIAVDRKALVPVCRRRGGTVGVDGCNASGFPGTP